jgi:universal stress protein A
MLGYNHVLCAVDFSSECQDVVTRAHMIAERARAKFDLVHVLEHTSMAFGGGEYALPLNMDLEESLREQAKQSLQGIADELGVAAIQWHLVEGSIKHGVIDLAKEIKCDLIVVGAHGHHGVAMLVGGNASGILHAAHCDVLAVHVD